MRRSRVLRDGALYHVCARVVGKLRLLEDETTKRLFMETVARARRKYDFRIETFTVMGNHVHLLIRPGSGECLSRIMQWILGVFAMSLNRRTGWWGHVWGDRFMSWIVDGFRALVDLFAYIDANPVRAGLVVQPREWAASALAQRRRGLCDIAGPIGEALALLFPAHAVALLDGRSQRSRP
ncbi:MAG: transposase [Spirochaetales bacterium]|nr:transposase [Spirochaetales bacterium]